MRRLDPRTIIVAAMEYIRQFLGPALIPIVLGVGRSGGGLKSSDIFFLWLPVGLGAFGILGGLYSFLVTQFGVENGVLIVRKTGIWRQERIIPLERIQNVSSSQTLLEKALKVQTLNVETGAGGTAEAKLKSLSMADAEALRGMLIGFIHTAGVVAEGEIVKPDEQPAIYKVSVKDLMVAGALQNRALYIVAGIMGVFNNSVGDLIKVISRGMKKLPFVEAASHSSFLTGIAFALGLFAFLAVGWILSIITSVVTHYGFRIMRTAKGLDIQYGLLTTVKTTIPLNRIQSLDTHANWMYRLLDLNQLQVSTIGSAPKQGEAPTMAGKTMLAPIARPEVVRDILALIYPEVKVDELRYRSCDPYFKRRYFFSNFLPMLIFCSFASVIFGSIFDERRSLVLGSAFGLLVVTALWTLYTSKVTFRRYGFVVTPEFVYVRTGTFSEQVTVLPVPNIQTAEITTNPFMARRGLSSIALSTPISTAQINCVPTDHAERLRDEVMRQKRRRGL